MRRAIVVAGGILPVQLANETEPAVVDGVETCQVSSVSFAGLLRRDYRHGKARARHRCLSALQGERRHGKQRTIRVRDLQEDLRSVSAANVLRGEVQEFGG